MIGLFLVFAFFSTAQAACPNPFSSALIDLKIQGIHKAIQGKKINLFQKEINNFTAQIPCMETAINSQQAAQYHLLQGIFLWISRKPQQAEVYFAAAKATDPDITIPTKLFPKVHQIHNSFHKAVVSPRNEKLQVPTIQKYYFDGLVGAERPLLRPTIFQVLEKQQLLHSSLLAPQSALPDFVRTTQSTAGVDAKSKKEKTSRRTSSKPILMKASIATAGVSSLLYLGALLTKSQHGALLEDASSAAKKNDLSMRTAENRKRAESLKSQNQVLFQSSLYLGITAVGMGGAGIYFQLKK